MSFKICAIFAILACANAGIINSVAPHYSDATAVSHSYIHQAAAPVHVQPAFAAVHSAPIHAAPVAVHTPAIGTTHESVLRSLGGNQVLSHYAKGVDTAFSTVRKYDTRVTNNALQYAPVVAHQAPVFAQSPARYVTHSAPVAAYTAHSAPAVATYSQVSAPQFASYAASSPVLTKSVSTYTHAAPQLVAHSAPQYVSQSAPQLVAHSAPQLVAHSAPQYVSHSAPQLVAHSAPQYVAHSAPQVATYAAQAPVLAKTAVAYSPASAVSHTSFSAPNNHYEW